MLEYMSVREAAAHWNVSERRVHKLCQDGRIGGLIRFGRSWGIPRDAEKPDDARRTDGNIYLENDSFDEDIADLLGPDAKLLVQSETFAAFQLENDTGNGIVTVYDAFPGVRLTYNDLHLSKITGHDGRTVAHSSEILVINHCREGRFECEFSGGECGYLGNGDLAVSQMPPPVKNSCFPLAHYHGISIMIDITHFSEHLGRALDALEMPQIDVAGIKNRLLKKSPFFILRATDAISHIFSELYNAPDELKESYIRLKLIELILFLSVTELKDVGERKYFYKTRVQTVKAMRDYMTEHLDRQFTMEELSARWGIPLTTMKTCFKSVFGVPIHTYMREYRLQTASTLLRETDEPIAEIAAKVGYDSHAQFSAAFKTATGTAPSDYRKVVVQNE